jgi:hypothetical protein
LIVAPSCVLLVVLFTVALWRHERDAVTSWETGDE